jgi:hypothetical protein
MSQATEPSAPQAPAELVAAVRHAIRLDVGLRALFQFVASVGNPAKTREQIEAVAAERLDALAVELARTIDPAAATDVVRFFLPDVRSR